MNKTKPKTKVFRVWIRQVNQTYVDVRATDAEEAGDKGYAKWRRTLGHSSVTYVAEAPKENGR